MFDGYELDCTKDGDDDLSDLDEYLTEYVDGTMDPAMQEAFEEYLEAHPELLDYVCCLNDVRCVLGELNCSCQAPAGVQARLRQTISCDMLNAEAQPAGLESARFRMLAVAAAAVVLVSVGAVVLYNNAATVGAVTQPVAQAVDGQEQAEQPMQGVQPSLVTSAQPGLDVVDYPKLSSSTYGSSWFSQVQNQLRSGELLIDPSMFDRTFKQMPMPTPLQPNVRQPLFHHTGTSRNTGFSFSAK